MKLRRRIGQTLARFRFKGIPDIMSQSLRFGGHVAGVIDTCGDGVVTGWVYDATRPSAPIALEVLIDGRVVATGRADHGRPDLGLLLGDDGRHGFEIRTDALGFPARERRSLSVRLVEKPSYVIGPVEVPPDPRWVEIAANRPPDDLPPSSFAGVGRFTDRRLPDATEELIFVTRLEKELWPSAKPSG